MQNVVTDTEAYFIARLPEMVEAARRLVEAESPSHDVPALNRCADALSSFVTSMVGHVPVMIRTGKEHRPHLRLDLGNRPDVLLIGHFDTVHNVGALAENPARVEDGRLYGPGALDMKGGLVSMVEIANYLRSVVPNPNITLFFNSDEEIGSQGSGSYLREIAAQARAVLVFDFGDNSRSLRNGARGAAHVRMDIKGKGGHAAYPERTHNPVPAIGSLISAAAALTLDRPTLVVSATGLTASEHDNVVPDTASVTFDIRGETQDDMDAAETFFTTYQPEHPELTAAMTVKNSHPPFVVSANNRAQAAAEQATDQLGWPRPIFKQERGASDANSVAPVIDSILVGLGGWGDGAHSSRREYLETESLVHYGTLGATICELLLKNAYQ